MLGGQAAVALVVPFGRNKVGVDATLTGALGPIGFTTGGSRTDSITGFGDLIPQFSLRWNQGVHNFMTYVTGDIPVGAYNSQRLANLGIGHGAIDGGGGYTYFNPMTGHEFSAVLGFTYNFENTATQYQNGIDMHLDWGASQFLTKQLQLGLVGLCLQAALLRQRGGQPGRLLRVTGVRHRTAAWLCHTDGRVAGLSEPESLQGIRRRTPAGGLERMADVRDFAGRTACRSAAAGPTNDRKIARSRSLGVMTRGRS